MSTPLSSKRLRWHGTDAGLRDKRCTGHHTLIAAQIQRALYFFTLSGEERRKQNFAAEACRVRLDRNRLRSQGGRDHDRRFAPLPAVEQPIAPGHHREVETSPA